jgi:hypothetical protein
MVRQPASQKQADAATFAARTSGEPTYKRETASAGLGQPRRQRHEMSKYEMPESL